MKRRTALIMALAGILLGISLLMGMAAADSPVPETPETSEFRSSTLLQVNGLVLESDSLSWQESSSALDGHLEGPDWAAVFEQVGPYTWNAHWEKGDDELDVWITTLRDLTGDVLFAFLGQPAFPGEVQATTSYREQTIADSGVAYYTKSMEIDTASQQGNTDSLSTERIIEFTGGSMGRISSEEVLYLETAGNYTRTGESAFCPFSPGSAQPLPQFSNRVEAGSKIDLETGLVATSASDRFIATTLSVPVDLKYEILVEGLDSRAAIGSVDAYLDAHSEEGRMEELVRYDYENNWGISIFSPGKATDLSYSESTHASGLIDRFEKTMHYRSGIPGVN